MLTSIGHVHPAGSRPALIDFSCKGKGTKHKLQWHGRSPEGNAFSVCIKQDSIYIIYIYICTVRICKGCEELNISHRSERKSGGQASWPAMDSIHQVRSKPWPSRFRKPQIITWQKHTYSETLTCLNVIVILTFCLHWLTFVVDSHVMVTSSIHWTVRTMEDLFQQNSKIWRAQGLSLRHPD